MFDQNGRSPTPPNMAKPTSWSPENLTKKREKLANFLWIGLRDFGSHGFPGTFDGKPIPWFPVKIFPKPIH